MSKYLVIILLCSLLILPGCFMEDEIKEDIYSEIPILGWIFLGSGGWHPDPDNDKNVDTDGANWINTTATLMNDSTCPKNQYWDYRYGTCMCNADYYMQDDICILKSTRECSVDRDCSPDGTLSTCTDQYSKRMYYCNLQTYKCSRPIVDCRTEYGQNYRCVNGNCVDNVRK
ncbi:MAG: hypothetical protein ACP5OA_00225 [Candidatus Woesearchaeota archaeon]